MWIFATVILTICAVASGTTPGPRTPDCSKTCSYPHPQVVYCKSDLVAKIKIENNKRYTNNDVAYQISVKDVIKSEPGCSWGVKIMYTECGTSNIHQFEEGKVFLVMGSCDSNGQLVLNSCAFSISMQNINCYQRKGIFKGEYGANCECIDKVGYGSDKSCNFESSSLDCYNNYAYCRKGSYGHCGWAKFWKFRDC